MILIECVLRVKREKYTKEEWPTEMAVRPLKGDCVESVSGKCMLRVVGIAHITRKNSYTKYPALKVYLSS